MNNVLQENRRPIPKFVTPEAKDLIELLLQSNPIKRPTIRQVLQHPWFNSESSGPLHTPTKYPRKVSTGRRSSSGKKRLYRRSGIQVLPMATSGYSASEDEDSDIGKRKRSTVLSLRKTNSCLASFPTLSPEKTLESNTTSQSAFVANVDSTATMDIDEEITQLEQEFQEFRMATTTSLVPTVEEDKKPVENDNCWVEAIVLTAAIDTADFELYKGYIGLNEPQDERVTFSLFYKQDEDFALPKAVLKVETGGANVEFSLCDKTIVVNTTTPSVSNVVLPWSIGIKDVDPYKKPLPPNVAWLVTIGEKLFDRALKYDEENFMNNPFAEARIVTNTSISLPKLFCQEACIDSDSDETIHESPVKKNDDIKSEKRHSGIKKKDDIKPEKRDSGITVYQDGIGCGYVDSETSHFIITLDNGEYVEINRLGSLVSIRRKLDTSVIEYDLSQPLDLPVRVLNTLVKAKGIIKAYGALQERLKS